jgi:nucleotide-binding universal stress UspA family protein
MSFGRIVVPYEGGHLSEDALRLACELAREGARITAVYVVKRSPSMPIGAEEAEAKHGREALARAEEVGRELGLGVETFLSKAEEVADGIDETAATLEADAIVLSLRHKHAAAETMLLSHTVSRVLRHAPCRVLIAYSRSEREA